MPSAILRRMRASLAVLSIAIAAGCASSSKTAMQQACEKNPAIDERCIDELTAVEYESREEVMAREEQRKDDAESDRLTRMRREEEERQAARGTESATVAMPLLEELAPEDAAALVSNTHREDETDAGSSVRALTSNHVDQKAGAPPTPEDYLRAAQCLLGDDLARMTAVFNAAKRAKSARAGEAAMAIVDGNLLLSQVKGELSHRGLPLSGNGICAADPTRRVVDLLRELVGPAVAKETDAEGYARGLARLRRELEVRAGLPKSEE